jgi:glyoxylase-like metal-dependent hydrolase (beta-lactamase superfamily II)
MTEYTIKPLLTGYQTLDRGLYATYGHGFGQVVELPVFAFLLEGGGRRILVDTGMSDTEQSVRFHHQGRQEAGQAIHEQLAARGIAPGEIDTIIFTHLHWDHCYNVKRFPQARLIVSETEYRFALDPIPFYWTSYEHPKSGLTPPFAGCSFDLTRGEEQIVDGIRVIPTPGHSPGHQSVAVTTADGLYVIAGDLFFVRDNLLPSKQRGWPMTPIGRFANIIELWNSMEKIVGLTDRILMSHDPSQIGVETYPVGKSNSEQTPMNTR